MSILTEEIKQKIRYLAGQAYPNECCGFLTEKGLMPIANTSEEPLHFAQIDPKSYALAEEEGITFMYHSHAKEPNFSKQDIDACKQLNIPFVLYCVESDKFTTANPQGGDDYVGRDWVYGINDCYGLVRDWYRQERGIILDDFARGEPGETKKEDWNVFCESFESQGFTRLSPHGIKFQAGDVLLMQIASPNPNHLGLIFDADKQEFMQHLRDRPSSIYPYGGFWSQHTIGVLRQC
jgi:proteasome lid subunit RPN8/RPN11